MRNKTELFLAMPEVMETEGWVISQTTGTNDEGDYRIERLDELNIFEDDEAAWVHVIKKASDNSPIHLYALWFISQNNETEFELIASTAAIMGHDIFYVRTLGSI